MTSETPELFTRLKTAAGQEWTRYTNHRFIKQMQDATLPQQAFRQYLIQDYLFLIQFARAYALAAYKSRTVPDIQAAQDGLAAILGETELHVRLCAEWDISPEELETAPEHQTTVAYTRYVLDCGNSGDLLDLHVALSPCVVGYAEIGNRLKPALDADPQHPYREWISEYAGKDYQETAAAAVEHIDSLAARSFSEARFNELSEIFTLATRLETQFWQMGIDLASQADR